MMGILLLIGTASFTQEAGTEGQQTQGAGSTVTVGMGPLGMGALQIHGMINAGARARMANSEGWAKDGNWALEGIDAIWEQNRADLYMDYSFANYGAFFCIRAQYFGSNSFDYGNPWLRYAFVYANLGPAKVSVGKLYDQILPVQGSQIWKSSGPGDSHRFTDDDAYSIRLEVKPVEGLNVGLQWFFPRINDWRIDGRNDISGYYVQGLDQTDAWKELGIGAQYSNSLFDAQLGVRFDSAVDRYNKLDTGPSGAGSYLINYYGEAKLLSDQIPASAFMAPDLTGGDSIGLPKYKHRDKLYKMRMDGNNPVFEWEPYDAGHYAFFGFNLKGIKNLTANAHGGLYNLGAFDQFGYGRFSEFIKYDKIIGGLGIGITMQQEFYGSDVFADTMYNSPFLQFGPQISYALITDPRMPLPILAATLDTSIGICADVLDIYAKIKPTMTLFLGTLMADLFYELEYTGYNATNTGIEPITRHTVGLSLLVFF
jgi:hypothetical protein